MITRVLIRRSVKRCDNRRRERNTMLLALKLQEGVGSLYKLQKARNSFSPRISKKESPL